MPQEWIDKRTGKKYLGDDDGWPIEQPVPTNSEQSVPKRVSYGGKYSFPVEEGNLKYVPDILNAAGGILGSRFGVKGSAAGAAIGSAAGQGLQLLDPRSFGKGPETFSEFTQQTGIDTGIDLLTSGLGKATSYIFPSARKRLGQQLVEKFFKSPLPDDVKNIVNADPDFPLTVGQTGNKKAQFLERTFGGNERTKLITDQLTALKKDFQRHAVNPEVIIQTMRENAIPAAKTARETTKALYNELSEFIPANTKKFIKTPEQIIPAPKTPYGYPQGKPTIIPAETIDIPGAVEVRHAYNFANQVGEQLDQILKPDQTTGNLAGGAGAKTIRLYNELQKIRGLKKYIDPKTGKELTTPVGEYETLKSLHNNINRYIKSDEFATMPDQLTGSLRALASTLKQDLDNGIKSWGTRAVKAQARAEKAHIAKAKLLDPEMTEMLLKAGNDPETTYMMVAEKGLSDPEFMRQMVKGSGGDRASAKQLVLQDLQHGATDPTNFDFIDPGKALTKMHDKVLEYKAALGSNGYGELKRHFTKAKLVSDFSKDAEVGLKYYAGRTLIALSSSSMATAFAGGIPIPAGIAGSIILTGGFAGDKFTKNVLMNQKNARIATGLLNADPLSPIAKKGTRAILLALKGTQIKFMTPDNIEHDARIDENGKVKLLD